MSQSRRDRNVPTIVVVENITTADRRDFPVPFGRMKHSIMPLGQILDGKFMLGRTLEKLSGVGIKARIIREEL